MAGTKALWLCGSLIGTHKQKQRYYLLCRQTRAVTEPNENQKKKLPAGTSSSSPFLVGSRRVNLLFVCVFFGVLLAQP